MSKELEDQLDLENARWQQRLDGIIAKYVPGIDGSGCDSGDPLDLTATELELALGKMQERIRELEQIAETRMESLKTVSAQRDSLAKQLNELEDEVINEEV